MKKAKPKKTDDDVDMLPEYDFASGVRGKHAKRYRQGSNVIVLATDVARFFGSARAVNRALRELMKASRETPARPGSARGTRRAAT